MDTPSTIYIRPPVWALMAAVVIGGAFYIAGKHLEVKYEGGPAVISVSADAKVSAAPNIAELTFGVDTLRQPTAKDALTKLSRDMNAVIEAVKAKGVEEKDIATEQLWMNPVYDYDEGRQIPRGFQAQQTLRVKVRDLDKVGEILTAATSAGANQAGGVSFTIDDSDELKAQARAQAIEKAQAKAKALADSLGVRLGALKGFNEGGGVLPPVYARMMDSKIGMGGGGEALPVPAGEEELRVEVTLTYEVK